MATLSKEQYKELDIKFKAAKDAWMEFHQLIHSSKLIDMGMNRLDLSKRHMIIEDEMDYLGLYVAEYKPSA